MSDGPYGVKFGENLLLIYEGGRWSSPLQDVRGETLVLMANLISRSLSYSPSCGDPRGFFINRVAAQLGATPVAPTLSDVPDGEVY